MPLNDNAEKIRKQVNKFLNIIINDNYEIPQQSEYLLIVTMTIIIIYLFLFLSSL